MSYSNDPWRDITKAAELRDWAGVDAVIEDLRVQGKTSVLRGLSDARIALGEVPRGAPMNGPNLVTVHDLPNLEHVEIVGNFEGGLRTWRPKKAA